MKIEIEFENKKDGDYSEISLTAKTKGYPDYTFIQHYKGDMPEMGILKANLFGMLGKKLFIDKDLF